MQGRRRQGRQRNRWEVNIRKWTGLEFAKSQRAVKNREKWRELVVKSSVVPQRPSRLRDKWSEMKWFASFYSELFYLLHETCFRKASSLKVKDKLQQETPSAHAFFFITVEHVNGAVEKGPILFHWVSRYSTVVSCTVNFSLTTCAAAERLTLQNVEASSKFYHMWLCMRKPGISRKLQFWIMPI